MAFGSPRPSVTATILTVTLVGTTLAFAFDGVVRWTGIAIALGGFSIGLLLGSWFQLLHGSKPVGRRKDL